MSNDEKPLSERPNIPAGFRTWQLPLTSLSVSLPSLVLSVLSPNSSVNCHITYSQLSPVYFVAFSTAATVDLGARGGTVG